MGHDYLDFSTPLNEFSNNKSTFVCGNTPGNTEQYLSLIQKAHVAITFLLPCGSKFCSPTTLAMLAPLVLASFRRIYSLRFALCFQRFPQVIQLKKQIPQALRVA